MSPTEKGSRVAGRTTVDGPELHESAARTPWTGAKLTKLPPLTELTLVTGGAIHGGGGTGGGGSTVF
jgi:hypothetical protein